MKEQFGIVMSMWKKDYIWIYLVHSLKYDPEPQSHYVAIIMSYVDTVFILCRKSIEY